MLMIFPFLPTARESQMNASANPASRQTRRTNRTRNRTTGGDHANEMTGGGGQSDHSTVDESPAMSPEGLMHGMSSLESSNPSHLVLSALSAEMIVSGESSSSAFSGASAPPPPLPPVAAAVITSSISAPAVLTMGASQVSMVESGNSNSSSTTTSSSSNNSASTLTAGPTVVAAPASQLQAGGGKRPRNRHTKSPVTKPSLRSNSNSGKSRQRHLHCICLTVALMHGFYFLCTESLASPMPAVNKRRRVAKEIK